MSISSSRPEGLKTLVQLKAEPLVQAELPATAVSTAELAIIIPTLNERDNVALVVERLNRVITGVAWEGIFVDDDSGGDDF
jgi:hypothetical protein